MAGLGGLDDLLEAVHGVDSGGAVLGASEEFVGEASSAWVLPADSDLLTSFDEGSSRSRHSGWCRNQLDFGSLRLSGCASLAVSMGKDANGHFRAITESA